MKGAVMAARLQVRVQDLRGCVMARPVGEVDMSNLGHTLRLSGAQGQVRRVLEITQLQIVLEHHDDVGDAVEAALSEYDVTR